MLGPRDAPFVSDWADAVSDFADVLRVTSTRLFPETARRISKRLATEFVNGGEVLWARPIRLRPSRVFFRLNAQLEGRAILNSIRVGTAGSASVDIVHSHFYPTGAAAVDVSRRLGVPLVHTEHSSNLAASDPRKYVSRAGRAIMRDVFSNAKAVMLVGEGQRAGASRLGLSGRFEVTGNPVPEVFSQVDRASRQRNRLITVGHLIERKRHTLLLEAFAKVYATNPNLKLDVVGDGPQRPILEKQIAELGLSQAVILLGSQSRSEVAVALGRADLYVHAAEWESFGVSIVEALLSGLPVVAVRCGGVTSELWEKAGTVVSKGDPDELAEAIRVALVSTQFADPLAIADWAGHRYGASVVRNRIKAVYQHALSEGINRSVPRHVLHVIDSLGSSGGAEQQLTSNLKGFHDERLRHRVLCLYEHPTSSRKAEIPASVQLGYLAGEGRRVRNRLSLIGRLFLAVRRQRPDLIHCALPDASLGARVAGLLLRVPVVESLVNISHESVRIVDNPAVSRSKLAIHRLLDRVTMRTVRRFHAISGTVAESWIRTVGLPRNRVVVIPRGLEPQQMADPVERAGLRSQLRETLELQADSFLILNVGRQVAQKGQLYAIRAMPEILAKVPRAVFVSVGSTGEMTNRLQSETVALGLTGNVIWLGVRNDLARLMAAADVFVFPSLYEGLGVSLLEAMAAGLACVTTDQGPMNEVVSEGETGLLVSKQNPEAIASAVTRLATDHELRRRLGENARKVASEGYDSSKVARALEQVYLDVLGISQE